jgi:hypothetical protein
MTHRRFSKSLLTLVAGAAAGLTLGCIISTNGGGSSDECGGVLSHSHETANGGCKCDAGYTWENPNDPNDYECERIDPKPSADCNDFPNLEPSGVNECRCVDGFNWCAPDDPNDFSCCVDDAQDSLSGTGSDTDDPSVSDTIADTGTGTTNDPTVADTSGDTSPGTSGAVPDPADCTVDTPDAIFCSNTEQAGPEGSVYYTCTDGTWTENATAADELCAFDGYDFAYGCVDDGAAIAFICGNGPGTACDDSTVASCVDSDIINACLFGRLTEDSCVTICGTIGDEEGITYDSGFCDAESDPVECFCCDQGEEGCPEMG